MRVTDEVVKLVAEVKTAYYELLFQARREDVEAERTMIEAARDYGSRAPSWSARLAAISRRRGALESSRFLKART